MVKERLQYSILSHRWGADEVTFRHIESLHEDLAQMRESHQTARRFEIPSDDVPRYSSLVKLDNFLTESAEKRCDYAWMDTICINKESSAELDESIRSMYAWYRDSHICIVYLSETDHYSKMERDPWFTRGWTLQELLAPTRFAFYSKNWKQITTTDNRRHPDEMATLGRNAAAEDSLWPRIAEITEIEIKDLLNFKPGLYDIRKKLTWASKRKTTRIEDMAYCLIGIFDINLSIAYGEKERAFYRLQVEILQNSSDMSLFDWLGQGQASTYNSLLAASPECFAKYLGLHTGKLRQLDGEPTYAQMTSVGIRVPLVIYSGARAASSWRHLYAGRSDAPPEGATAFSILGPSSRLGYHVALILGVGDSPRQYGRLALIETMFDLSSSNRVPEFIFIK